MRKKLQVALTDEAWTVVNSTTKEANSQFKNGFISCSDVVTEMIMQAKIDIKGLQAKHTGHGDLEPRHFRRSSTDRCTTSNAFDAARHC
jgi:hypothetical protein